MELPWRENCLKGTKESKVFSTLYTLIQSLWRRANARNASFFTLYGGQFTFSTQMFRLNYLLYFLSVARHNPGALHQHLHSISSRHQLLSRTSPRRTAPRQWNSNRCSAFWQCEHQQPAAIIQACAWQKSTPGIRMSDQHKNGTLWQSYGCDSQVQKT